MTKNLSPLPDGAVATTRERRACVLAAWSPARGEQEWQLLSRATLMPQYDSYGTRALVRLVRRAMMESGR